MSSLAPPTTANQPTLPAEGAFTDAELDFMENSPPGLFPENQNSNFGFIIRKIYTDCIQDLISQEDELYNERFVNSSVDYLDVWEQQMGVPIAPTTLTVAQRRLVVLNRIQVGPFTNARRNAIIESYITATFGPPIQFSPAGISLPSAGTPFYTEGGTLSSMYAVRENYPALNLLANGSFETNTTGWSGTATLTRDTTNYKFGVASMKAALTAANQYTVSSITLSGATAGRVYTASVWLYADATNAGKQWQVYLNESGGASGAASTTVNVTLVQGWQRVIVTRTIVQNDRTALNLYVQRVGGASGDAVWIDGAQIEAGPTSSSIYNDPSGSAFYYEVRLQSSLTVDLVGLTRELTRITPAGISFAIVSVPNP